MKSSKTGDCRHPAPTTPPLQAGSLPRVRASVRRRGVCAALAAAAVLGSSSLPAEATPAREAIASKRQQAVAAQAELEVLGRQIEPAVERFNQAKLRVDTVRAAIATNEAAIGRISTNQVALRRALKRALVGDYRRGEPDLLTVALTGGSLSTILERLTLARQAERSRVQIALDLRSTQRELDRRQRQLADDKKQAIELSAQARQREQEVRRAVAAQKQTITRLKGEVRSLVAEEVRRQAALRRETLARLAAARAARAAAAAVNRLPDPGDPGIGGSGGAGGSTVAGAVGGATAAGGGSGRSTGAGSGSGSTTDGGGSAPAPTAPPPSDGSAGATAVAAALSQLGVPYVWGGATPGSAFDCSGLTQYAWGKAGVSLSHFTGAQWNEGVHVSRDQLQPGDLVFFGSDLGHMGMYIGNNQMVHAPHTGDVVKISSLAGYYDSNFAGAVRPG